MSSPSIQQIIAAVDALENETVQMLHEIVAHPSLLNDEKSAQEFMVQKFQELQDPTLSVKRVPVERTLRSLSSVIRKEFHKRSKQALLVLYCILSRSMHLEKLKATAKCR